MIADSLATIVSTKGQVILPKAVRDHLHWSPGTRLLVEETKDGVVLREAGAQFAPTKPDDVFGALKYVGKAKSIEEMDAGIAAEVEHRHARGRY